MGPNDSLSSARFNLTLVCSYPTRLPDSFLCVIDSMESPIRWQSESLRNQRQTLAIRLIHALSQRHAASPSRQISSVFQSLMEF